MAVNLSPIGGVAGQFFDNNGDPLSGGKIFTYAAGTTTPQATYTTATGITPHTNPIILDAAGRVPNGEIWLSYNLQYKFIIKTSADVQIGSYDNILGINSNFVNYAVQTEIQTATAGQTVFTLTTVTYTPGSNTLTVFIDGVNQYVNESYTETNSTTVTFSAGLYAGAEVKFTTSVTLSAGATASNLVTYTAPRSGSVTRTVQSKLDDIVSVLDFGAIGDGITNDAAAFTAAWTASNPEAVLVPAGTYAITGTVTGKFFSFGAVTVVGGTVTSITNLVP